MMISSMDIEVQLETLSSIYYGRIETYIGYVATLGRWPSSLSRDDHVKT